MNHRELWYLLLQQAIFEWKKKYLIGEKKVGIYFSRGKYWSGKNLVTLRNFSHFSPTNFFKLVTFLRPKFAIQVENGTQFFSFSMSTLSI